MQQLPFNVSNVFIKNLEGLIDSRVRIVCNQGGTSSGKTYSISQLIYAIGAGFITQELVESMIKAGLINVPKQYRDYSALKPNNKLDIEIAALSVPHYKTGALTDWKNIYESLDPAQIKGYNKTDQVFQMKHAQIRFEAYDKEGKARGPRRDIQYFNELNLIPEMVFQQVALRTRSKVFIDYNPADEFHWIYDKILTRGDVMFIQSTYLDNYDFLPEFQIKEIELMEVERPSLWRVYGLGERGVTEGRIYPDFQMVDEIPEHAEKCYGLDFGGSVPTSLVECGETEKMSYWNEIIYERNLTTSDLIQRFEEHKIPKHIPIYADSAEPDRIEEIRRAGYNIHMAVKAVWGGISHIQRGLSITKRSVNALKEARSYVRKKHAQGHFIDEPVKRDDHAMDAGRYGSYTHHMSIQTNFDSLYI